ncbi:MAG: enoyl-CoA hydratase-related protein [Deinococcales bacterium]
MPEHILLESPFDGVRLIRLNRPKVLNALNRGVMQELASALLEYSSDDSVRVVVLTGSERAFAAGADISEMSNQGISEMLTQNQAAAWRSIAEFPKPLIGAISGVALGGGLELAMTCDILLAAENARLGQPEINLGIIPGAGGTQRLTHAVGKSLAMEMVLNARMLSAEEALRYGLVSSVYPPEVLLHHTLQLAKQIAARAPLALRAAKASVNAAFELGLQAGLGLERQNFALLFGTQDQKEGMQAFLEKRRAVWKGK